MFYIIVTLLAVVGIALVLLSGRKQKDESIKVNEEPTIDPVDDSISKLFNLNLRLRLVNPSEKLVQSFEEVVDKTRVLLPILNQKDKFSELTVTVNRIPTKYLPSLIEPYISVSERERESMEADIVANLNTLSEELDRIQEALDNGEKDSYQRMSVLIDNLFNEVNMGDYNASK